MQGYFSQLFDSLSLPLTQFLNPDSRLHLLYLISSLLIAIIFLWSQGKIKNSINYLFPKSIWLHPSARIDYFVFIINIIFISLLIIPFIITTTEVFSTSYKMLQSIFGPRNLIEMSSSTTLILYTILLWLVGDFTRFLTHYLMHKIPFLWEFHKVHHSAEVLTPITQYRSHPVEVILFNLRSVISIGFVTALCTYFFSYELNLFEVMSINVFRFIFLALGSNLRHSHIPITYGKWLEYIFISPAQHQIHHSNDPKHFDTNMGSHLAIWDWIFGTLQHASKATKLVFGLDEKTKIEHRKLWKVYLVPFLKAIRKNP